VLIELAMAELNGKLYDIIWGPGKMVPASNALAIEPADNRTQEL